MNLGEFMAMISGALGGYFLAVCYYETFVIERWRRQLEDHFRQKFSPTGERYDQG